MKRVVCNTKTWLVKLISFLSLVLLVSSTANSQNTEDQAAKQYAADFFNASQQSKTGLKSAVSVSALTQCYQSGETVKTPLFVFQKADKGFAMIAKSHTTYKVVGYSDEESFETDNIPPQLLALMTYYEDSLTFMNPVSTPLKAGTPIVPSLLDAYGIRLNQYIHSEYGGCPTGCVATAVTQIMLYHAARLGKPIKGYGAYCYTDDKHGELCADFENADYNSDDMLLSLHVGNSMEMQYCGHPLGSIPNRGFAEGLEKHFHYFVRGAHSKDYYIKNELEHQRPVYITLLGEPVGHAFVLDGYDSRSYYHLNFGWGGHYNGYYLLNHADFFGAGNIKFFTNIKSPSVITPTLTPVNIQDSLALVAVHNALGGYEATHWDLSKSVWRWPGLLIMNDRVIDLTLVPSIPPASAQSIAPEIGNLTELKELHISGCLNGTIPATITKLTNLQKLSVANNVVYISPALHKGNLQGELPSDIDKLDQLETLYITNALEGTIPASIGNLSSLKTLSIRQDTAHFGEGNLTGSIPDEIGNLSKLQQFYISNQKLSGKLPETINNLTGLVEIDLSGNQLSGAVPSFNLPNIIYLRLNDNAFSEISAENGNCPSLTYIELQNNQISGELPSVYGNFSALKSLNLYDNQISSLPEELGNLIQLERLIIDNNQLQALPNGLALNLRLKEFSASNNQIAYLPSNLGQSGTLETLDLSNNQITNIPSEIGNCPKLYQLLLNNNHIDSIPATFANIWDKATVLLHDNEMRGAIPEKLMMNESQVRLDNNRFVFNDIPKSDQLKFGVRNQKNVQVQKQLYKVQIGDTVTIDVRNVTNLSDPDNEYYWLAYPDFLTNSEKAERIDGLENSAVLKVIINEQTVNNKYHCRVFNSTAPSYSFEWLDYSYTSPCMESLNTDTIAFILASDEEIIAEKYTEEFVTSLASIPNKTISDGTVTLVPPIKIKRGEIFWEVSADGELWERISGTMEREDLKANVKSVSSNKLELTPKNTAYYRCCINETDCDPLVSDKLKVNAFGNVLFDEILNVTEEARTISVDSIEIVVPINFHDTDFRLTITKLENPPAAPDSVKSSSVYDVNVSFGSVFENPLLIKFKNVDMKTFDKMDADKYKAAYYSDENQKWELYGSSGISLKDSTVEFFTNHLTKLAWFELAHGSFTHIHTRDHVNIIYKFDQDWISWANYEKTMKKGEPWHTSNTDADNGGTPYLIQDMGEYMDQIIEKFKSLGLETPSLRFNVYVDSKQKHAGSIGFCGYTAGRGYFNVNPTFTTDPLDVRRTLAHEYMHYTQDYYMTVTLQNYWWQEAHAPLSDRMVWDDKIQVEAESEYLLKVGRIPSKQVKSIFEILSNSWYDDNNIPLFSKAFTDSNDPNLASTFLHYMRSYRTGEKLKADVLLKGTTYFGTWVNYLDGYIKNNLNSTIGDEYEDFVKYILSGDSVNYTLVNKNGNPYSYLQNPKNKGVFNFPVSYNFKEGDEIPQKDEMEIKVPYMAAKVVLLENLCPDSLVLVNYKRKHNFNDNHLVYYAAYDYKKEKMIYQNISDSIGYNFLLDARNKENISTKFGNYGFLLLINKNAVSTDFDASFELTASPVLNIENIGKCDIYNGDSPIRHNFEDKSEYILIGTPDASFIQTATGFNTKMINKNITKKLLNNHTYQIKTQYTLIIDQGQIKGMPTMKDSTVFTQTIENDVLSGTIKITEQENKFYKLNTFIEFVMDSEGEIIGEKVVYKAYTEHMENYTKTYWLEDIMSYLQPETALSGFADAYGENIKIFKTNNTFETQRMVSKIDAKNKSYKYSQSGVLTSQSESNYVSTDYTNPNLYIYLIIRTSDD